MSANDKPFVALQICTKYRTFIDINVTQMLHQIINENIKIIQTVSYLYNKITKNNNKEKKKRERNKI